MRSKRRDAFKKRLHSRPELISTVKIYNSRLRVWGRKRGNAKIESGVDRPRPRVVTARDDAMPRSLRPSAAKSGGFAFPHVSAVARTLFFLMRMWICGDLSNE